MSTNTNGIRRRDFLKYAALAGAAGMADVSWSRISFAASKERLTILSSIGLDTLNPYKHSASPQYGIWQHMIEPLVEINYKRKEYYGVLAQSWEFQGNKWVLHLR